MLSYWVLLNDLWFNPSLKTFFFQFCGKKWHQCQNETTPLIPLCRLTFIFCYSCTNMMIQNVLNFVNAILVKFCHARFLSALNEMLATLEWPSTVMLRHFIKPTVANVCATRAHLFAQNPLKVIFNLIWPTSYIIKVLKSMKS